MAIIYKPKSVENYEVWHIKQVMDDITFTLIIWIDDNNCKHGTISCRDVKYIFFIYILDDEIIIKNRKKISKIFDIDFSETKYKLSSMDEKFMNKVREIVNLFDLSNNEMFSEMFSKFITPKFKLHFVD
jgi:hypothetical protein